MGRAGKRKGVRPFHIGYRNVARLARSLKLEAVLQAIESDLQLYVAENARRRVFIHAGVVAWKGKAILIPGRSFTGKTTLVAELVKAGASYYAYSGETGHPIRGKWPPGRSEATLGIS